MPATASAEKQALEVDLPVCPTCLRVGKHPEGQYKGFCVGPASETHRRVKTTRRRFREIMEDEGQC